MFANFFKARTAVFMAGTTLVFMASAPLFATETLTITDSAGGSVTCTQTAGVTTGPCSTNGSTTTTGTVAYTGSVGNWHVSVDVGASTSDSGGTPTSPVITLSSSDSALAGALSSGETLTVTFSDNNFGPTPAMGGTLSTSTTGFSGGDKAALSAYQNAAQLGSTVNYSGTGSNSNNYNVGLAAGSSYSLTLKEVITGTTAKNSANSVGITLAAAAPEPGFYGVMTAGFAGLLFFVARKRKAINA